MNLPFDTDSVGFATAEPETSVLGYVTQVTMTLTRGKISTVGSDVKRATKR